MSLDRTSCAFSSRGLSSKEDKGPLILGKRVAKTTMISEQFSIYLQIQRDVVKFSNVALIVSLVYIIPAASAALVRLSRENKCRFLCPLVMPQTGQGLIRQLKSEQMPMEHVQKKCFSYF